MADNVKTRRISGSQFTSKDILEVQLSVTGDLHQCVQFIEVVSGVDVTHGGGAEANEALHYKAYMRDDGSTDAVDGIIDYSSSQMAITQKEKGTSVIKVVVWVISKADHDNFETEMNAWLEEVHEEATINATPIPWGDAPTYPGWTEHKSGEITLTWQDDTFV